jgi:hypothetical protein
VRLRALIVVLASVLAGMMAVVMVRAQATSLHYRLSRLDRKTAALEQELREKELELARLHNPALIHAKLEALRTSEDLNDESSDRRVHGP